MADTTTIEIEREVWRELNSRKYPGDSFNDVIKRLLEDDEASEEFVRASESEEESDPAPVPDTDDEIERAIELGSQSWEDKPAKLEARRAAARAVLKAIRDKPRGKTELIEEFYDRHSVEGQGERTWWRNNLKSEKADHPGPIDYVASFSHSSNKYEWHGLDEDQEE